MKHGLSNRCCEEDEGSLVDEAVDEIESTHPRVEALLNQRPVRFLDLDERVCQAHDILHDDGPTARRHCVELVLAEPMEQVGRAIHLPWGVSSTWHTMQDHLCG